jgi:hypothetical protein
MNPRKSLAWRLLPSARRGGRWVGCEPSEPWEPGGPSLLPGRRLGQAPCLPTPRTWLMPVLFSATISPKPPFFHIVSRRHRASLKARVSGLLSGKNATKRNNAGKCRQRHHGTWLAPTRPPLALGTLASHQPLGAGCPLQKHQTQKQHPASRFSFKIQPALEPWES